MTQHCCGQAAWTGDVTAHAEMIELCLFSADGRKELARIALPERDGDIWHVHVGGLTPGTLYGYRAGSRL